MLKLAMRLVFYWYGRSWPLRFFSPINALTIGGDVKLYAPSKIDFFAVPIALRINSSAPWSGEKATSILVAGLANSVSFALTHTTQRAINVLAINLRFMSS